MLLLVGAGLLLRTLLAVQDVERGYGADEVLTMMVDPLGSRYPTDESLQQFYEQVGAEVGAVPGVKSVAWASTLPLGPSSGGQRAFTIVGEQAPDDTQRPLADYQIVSHSYFGALDLPIVDGRAFGDRDTRESPLVCIVNEAFVRTHLRGQNPIGRQVALTLANAPQQKPVLREIVGVARQVKGRPDETEELMQIYVPMTQGALDDTYLLVRPAVGTAAALAPAVRAAIARLDTAQLVSVGAAEDARRRRSTAPPRRIASARCWWWPSRRWRSCSRWWACSASSPTRCSSGWPTSRSAAPWEPRPATCCGWWLGVPRASSRRAPSSACCSRRRCRRHSRPCSTASSRSTR